MVSPTINVDPSGGDHGAVREGEVGRRDRHRPVRIDPHEVRRRRRLTGLHVEAEVADVGPTLGVDHHVVGVAAAVLAERRHLLDTAVEAVAAGAGGRSSTRRATTRPGPSRARTAARRPRAPRARRSRLVRTTAPRAGRSRTPTSGPRASAGPRRRCRGRSVPATSAGRYRG